MAAHNHSSDAISNLAVQSGTLPGSVAVGQPITNYDDEHHLVNQFGSMQASGSSTAISDINDSFNIIIPYGTHFKSLCNFLEATSSSGHLVIVPEGIIFSQYNKESIILNRAEIFSNELPVFEFLSDSGVYVIAISPSMFKNCLGKVPQTADISLRKNSGTSDIEIKLVSQTGKRLGGTINYTPVSLEYEDYEINDDQFGSEIKPLCVVRSSDITTTCEQLVNRKIAYVTVLPKDNYLLLQGYDKMHEYMGHWPIGNNVQDVPFLTSTLQLNITHADFFKIDISTIKAWKMLSQLNKKSCIKFYTSLDEGNLKRIKINCHIGSYGILSIYIKDYSG